MGATCPKCHEVVALLDGYPNVTSAGVELWHPSCWAVRHARPVEPVAVVLPQRTRLRGYVIGGAAIASLVVGGGLVITRHASASPSAILSVDNLEPIVVAQKHVVKDDAPPVVNAPVVNGSPLDEEFPSLLDWVHPVTGTTEHMPEQQSRWFGAERKGIERSECGAGHCGVDLDGPEGRPVVAVSDGTVVRVERHELGLDGKSGRYVKIEHDDGTLTAYMHLDDIADGLEVGDRVDGNQYIGTLGSTAVYGSVPHLHFSLEVPNVPGRHGDNTNTHYVDPSPFLLRASISPVPERKHAIKPAN